MDPKVVEAQLLSAQGQIVAGNLDAGLKALAEVRAKGGPALAPRIAFVEKLVAVRVADRLGDQAKVSAGLAEALKQAGQPDQLTAGWQLGSNLAQAAVAAKGPAATGLIDILAAQAAPALRQFGPRLEVARLRIAVGQAAAAEAELTNAAARIASPQDRTAWAATVADLAKLVDGGQAPQAGIDLFERMRKAAGRLPVQAALDVVEGRSLLARGLLPQCQEVLKRAIAGLKAPSSVGVSPASKEPALPVLGLAYDLAVAYHKAGNVTSAAEALAAAEAMALALPGSVEATATRSKALVAAGRADSAAEIAWNAAVSAKQPAVRQQMLLLYVPTAVAAGREAEILPKLQAMKAPVGIFTAAAGVMAERAQGGGGDGRGRGPAAADDRGRRPGGRRVGGGGATPPPAAPAGRRAAGGPLQGDRRGVLGGCQEGRGGQGRQDRGGACQAGRRLPGPCRPIAKVTEERRGPRQLRRGPFGVGVGWDKIA